MNREAFAGAVLLCAAAVALAWANSPFSESYQGLWHWRPGGWQPLHFWINDVLMAVFFLVVGLELRHEMREGSLATLRAAALPVVAALGGVVVPALLYLSLNLAPAQRAGWAVPTATDIAFAVGVLALLGRAVPPGVRILLLALAVIDDLLAVLVIAGFYSGGLHASLAGVVLGLLIPARLGHGLQHGLQPWVSFGVMPLFALANAGVALGGIDLGHGPSQAVMAGVALALVVGKPLGVVGAAWLAVGAGWCRLPPGVDWRGVWLVGLLAGIGFTMAIFIGTLAFADERLLDAAKAGILVASVLAALAGLGWGLWTARRPVVG